MKSVSPVNTARSSPSSTYQQMLSCVWQGVCSAVTVMPWPSLKDSLWPGVLVTASQSLPPMMGRERVGKWESCGFDRVVLGLGAGGVGVGERGEGRKERG